MMKKLLVLLEMVIITISLILPCSTLADCVNLERYTGWHLEEDHWIVFYEEQRPKARINVPDCDINPSSRLFLIKSYICDSDTLMINNEECNILTVETLY